MQNNAPSGFQGFHFPLQQSDLYTFAPASQNQNQQQQQQQLYYAAQAAHGQQPSTDSSESAGPSQKKKPAGARKHGVKEEPEEHGKADEPKKKRSKRSAGKACVYCRRSHMVCEGGRPCERCIKREIPHLCRDCTPPPHTQQSPHKQEPQQQQQAQQQQSLNQPQVVPSSSQQMPVYADSNFVPSWPLLPDSGAAQIPFGEAPSEQIQNPGDAGIMGPPSLGSSKEDGELAALSKFMKDLGVPNLPNDFLSFMNQLDKPEASNSLSIASSSDANLFPSSGASQGVGLNKGKGKLGQMSRIDKYLMAAADQPNGTRASRLAQVIKAKYDAGLLKPYDYAKGYERMNKWMESGRAAPRMDSRAGSEIPEESPQRSTAAMRNGRLSVAPLAPNVPAFGKSISPESRRRILAALAGFRPKFRQIARTLTNVDLVFVEEAMERWMLEYDRAFASIHTPSCIWRRTGEIQKANQEFSNLTGIPAYMFRDGQLCVYELMDEDSAVRYWEGYAKIAFDPSQRAMSILCTLHIPLSLTRHRPRHLTNANPNNVSKSATSGPPPQAPYTPDLALPQQNMFNDGASSDAGTVIGEEYREMKCAFSVTIRRDAWGVPVAIMGQWIPIQ
ncbi:transcriptional regulatory protein [Cryptococcus neoformans Tu401-1]|nr:transcriptional regulatory protein [Cryptococcus neoformans var. grubii Tu401-1]OXM80908.1 transcriptional regulatory protein [Cryptococcus neoformans var. grubii Bt63]